MSIMSPDRAVASVESPASAWERRIVLLLSITTLLLITLPIIYGLCNTPPHKQFLGVPYNSEDFCNYLSWIRQTADGSFFLRDLFTTDPQSHLQFNLFFWLMGAVARATNWPLAVVWHVARVTAAIGVLWIAYLFTRACIPSNRTARLIAFGFMCLGSGFGWLRWESWKDRNPTNTPIDSWQPEAYTFLSIYTSALFAISLLFIVGAIYAMLLGERTGKARYAVVGGLCGAMLANIHTYDVIHISAAWGLFIIVWTVMRLGRGMAGMWLRTMIAGAVMAPATLYQYYVLKTNPVFQSRVNVPTLSPPLSHYVLGYGIPFGLAVIAVAAIILQLIRRKRRPALDGGSPGNESPLIFANAQTAVLLVCWAVAGLAVIYEPVAYQRRMLMGEHFPLCLLAGAGASLFFKYLKAIPARIVFAMLLILASMPSNVLFVVRDINHLNENKTESVPPPYLPDNFIQTLSWIRRNTPPDAAVVGFPDDCIYVPGFTGRAVWSGHWGETPDYRTKFVQFYMFADRRIADNMRPGFLRMTRAQYLLYPTIASGRDYVTAGGLLYSVADFARQTPPYLTEVYSNPEYTVFRINAAPQ